MGAFEQKVSLPYGPRRMDAYLAGVFAGSFSRAEIQKALRQKKIKLNGTIAKPSTPLKQGDLISGVLEPSKGMDLQPEAIPLKVIYEDEWVLVVDKPAGMVVHPGAGRRSGTLAHALLGRAGTLSSIGGIQRPGIVHRLDKDTSGLLLVAKTNLAHRHLQSQFAARTLSKKYLAMVRGVVKFEEGRVETPIGRDPRKRQRMTVSQSPSAKAALTRYRVLRRFPQATLLEIKPLTGRTHQIRVHLKSIGHPILGDPWYGGGIGERLFLHASEIEFSHPETAQVIKLKSEMPEDFKAVIQRLEAS